MSYADNSEHGSRGLTSPSCAMAKDDKYDFKNFLRNGQLPVDVPLIQPKPKGSGWVCPACGDEPPEGIDEKTGEKVPVAIAATVDGIKTIHCAPCVQRLFAHWQ